VASVYEGMTDAEKKVACYLKELNLWWIYEFPVFVYDDKKRPRVWTPDFYIPKLGMYIEVCGKQRQDYEFRENIYKENGYHVIFLHLYKEQNMWKKYLVKRIMEIEDLRHSEIEKMVGELINQVECVRIEKSLIDVHVEIKPDSLEEIRKIYPRAYEKWTIKEDKQLTSEYEQDKSIPRLAITHQRKTEEIRSRLKEIGLLSIKKIT
jgi:hypothetical protein